MVCIDKYVSRYRYGYYYTRAVFYATHALHGAGIDTMVDLIKRRTIAWGMAPYPGRVGALGGVLGVFSYTYQACVAGLYGVLLYAYLVYWGS